MKITLRKANAIQAAIVEAIERLPIETEIEINEFQNPEEEIRIAYDKFVQLSNTRSSLLDALYEIRKLVAKANAGPSRVSDLLADIARAEKDIRFFSYSDTIKPRLSETVLAGKLAKLKEPDSRGGFGQPSIVTTRIVSEDDITCFKQTMQQSKKKKQKLQDLLLEANIRNEIELSKETEDTLVKGDFI